MQLKAARGSVDRRDRSNKEAAGREELFKLREALDEEVQRHWLVRPAAHAYAEAGAGAAAGLAVGVDCQGEDAADGAGARVVQMGGLCRLDLARLRLESLV